ncbi:UNVERIFIED_CONTAM: hypothetical protein GTU68_043984 [Idotea baltica]|nr:hypothetical protein [Idotea baltica]
MSTTLIINDKTVTADIPESTTLLDFIRYHQHLKGTKIGCREGDCGACTVMIGKLQDGITPLANAAGAHVVTIEGLNMDELSPVQQAMVDRSGSQCGFCTPGFIVSMTSCTMNHEDVKTEDLIQAIDGNICRCTGYTPMQRVCSDLNKQLAAKDLSDPLNWAVEKKFIPTYFKNIPNRLAQITVSPPSKDAGQIVGGGTDLYVQRHDDLHDVHIMQLMDHPELIGITIDDDRCTIGGASTASDLLNNSILNNQFSNLKEHLLLVSSTPIRNMGTLAGNLVNASPIGDLTAFFLGLDSQLTLASDTSSRTIFLKDFYQGYKKIDRQPDELVQSVSFVPMGGDDYFNFEKISKRTYLDIASVNSAMRIRTDLNTIQDIHISAGGVGPTPKYLNNTRKFLIGKPLRSDTVLSASRYIQEEISPISDARGTDAYKRLALRQLIFGHFISLFPALFNIDQLINADILNN